MVRSKEKKQEDDKRFLRFKKAVGAAIDDDGGYMPPEWAGDPLILKLMLMRKELAVVHRKARHGCYEFNCLECDQ